MKNMPWQDIYSLAKWDRIIGYFKKGQMKTSGPSAKKKLGFFKIKSILPPAIAGIDRKIQEYHRIPKQSIEMLGPRAGALRTIAAMGQTYQTKHAIPEKPQLDKKGAGNKQRWEANMDYAIAKLVRRARRKATYIEQLQSLYGESHPGFAGVKALLKYIVEESKAPEDVNLVGMKRGLIMERIDPWHRDFELDFKATAHSPTANQEKLYGMAFVQWMGEQRNTSLPFFVWAEGHYMCTEAMKDDIYRSSSGGTMHLSSLIAQKGHIQYEKSDEELAAGILMLCADSSKLYAYNYRDNRGFIYEVYDTTSTHRFQGEEGYQKNIGDRSALKKVAAGAKNAYAWTKDKFVFAAAHRVGNLHHSSFVSGDAVRCAGMIGVKKGKVTWLDNDSGHYQPTTQHLRNFVNHLASHQVFAPDAQVYDESTKQVNGWKEFSTYKPTPPPKSNRPSMRPQKSAQAHNQGSKPGLRFKCASCQKSWPTRGLCTCPMKGPVLPV